MHLATDRSILLQANISNPNIKLKAFINIHIPFPCSLLPQKIGVNMEDIKYDEKQQIRRY